MANLITGCRDSSGSTIGDTIAAGHWDSDVVLKADYIVSADGDSESQPVTRNNHGCLVFFFGLLTAKERLARGNFSFSPTVFNICVTTRRIHESVLHGDNSWQSSNAQPAPNHFNRTLRSQTNATAQRRNVSGSVADAGKEKSCKTTLTTVKTSLGHSKPG